MLRVATIALAAMIFLVDTLSPLGMAVAVLYVVVLLMAVRLLSRRGVLAVALGFAALSVLSYLFQHGGSTDVPLARLLVSLAAIGITTFLLLENQAATAGMRRQAALLDLTHDAVFVRDMHDVITYWNRGAEALYGIPREEAVGRVAHWLLGTSFPVPLADISAELIERDRWEGELTHTGRDGQPIFVASRWALLRDGQGRPTAILETTTDITARKRAEERLVAADRQLAHVTRVSTLGEFAASIAHEVNQPLAAVVTNGEVCLRWLDRDEPDLGEVREAVVDMIAAGRRASAIIDRLRSLSRKTEAEKVPIDLNALVEEVQPLVRREVVAHRVALRLELAPDLPPVLADRVQLQQVVLNLIVNGMEAMSAAADGPRSLLVRSGRDSSGGVFVAVEDSGPGIDAETERRLFEPFFTTKPGGMGMGLSITRSIVESFGGKLSAARNPGPGATFRFVLPAHGNDPS